MYYAVRVNIGDQSCQTKSHGKGHESRMEQDLTFALEGVDGRESVTVDVVDDHDTVLCSGEVAVLGDLIEGRKGESYPLEGHGHTAHVVLTSKWEQHTQP